MMKHKHTFLPRSCSISLTFLAFLSIMSSGALGANIYWDGTVGGSVDGKSSGGSGNWNTTNSYWDNGSALVPWNNAANDKANFGNGGSPPAGGTVTLTEDITVGALQFNNASSKWTLTSSNGSTLTFAGAGELQAYYAPHTIDVVIAGTTPIDHKGNGKVIFTKANTYSGTTILSGSGGNIELRNLLALANSPLDTTGYGTITLNAGSGAYSLGGLLNSGAGRNLFGGVIDGGASLLTELILDVDSGNSFGYSGANTVIGDNGSNMRLTKTGGGTQTLGSGNMYTGPTVITGGQLTTWNLGNGGSNSSIGKSSNAAGNLIFDGGTLAHGGGSAGVTDRDFTIRDGGATIAVTWTGGITWNGSPAYDVPNEARSLTLAGGASRVGTFNGNIGDNGSGAVSLTKTGNGTWTLSGANTYSGPTTVTGGTLIVTGSISSDVIDVQGGTFDGSSGTLPTTFSSLGGSGTIDLGGATVTLASTGTLSPGNSPGTLTVADGLDISAVDGTGGLVFEIGDDPGYDSVVVGGTLTVGTLNFDDFSFSDAGLNSGGVFTLFDTSSAISGSIGVAEGAIGGFAATLSLSGDGQDVLLSLTAIPEPGTAILAILGLAGISFRRRRGRKRPYMRIQLETPVL